MLDKIKQFLRKHHRAVVITGLAMLFLEISILNGVSALSAQRRDLLNLGLAISKTLDVQEILALTGSSEDLDKLNYRRLQARLRSVADNNQNLRFIYIFGLRDNQVVFLLDSESAANRLKYGDNTSKPGDRYEEADENVWSAFRAATAKVSGPATDRWGTFMSVLAPIIDPDSGQTVAVLGVDVLYKNWLGHLAAKSLPPLAVGAAFIIGYILITHARDKDKHQARELRLMKYAIDNAANPIIWIDKRGMVVYANFAATKIFGRSLDDMGALYFWKLLVEGSKQDWQGEWRNAKNQGSSSTYTTVKNADNQDKVYRVDSTHIIFDGDDYYLVFAYELNQPLERTAKLAK